MPQTCPKGKYKEDCELCECEACPKNTYADQVDSECKNCPEGYWTNQKTGQSAYRELKRGLLLNF